MAKKRFTDTEIWKKKWFRELSCRHKVLWFYLKDNCSNAGLIDFDDVLASVLIGETITDADLNVFGDRLYHINELKYFLVDFLDFQYGKLSENCNPHKRIILEIAKIEERYGFSPENFTRVPLRVPGRLLSSLEEEEEDQEEEEEEDKEEDKAVSNNALHHSEVITLWNIKCTKYNKLPKVKVLSPKRTTGINAIIKKFPEMQKLEDWNLYFEKIHNNEFLTGKNKTGWKCNFDFVINQNNLLKIVEGNYDKPEEKINEWSADDFR